MVRRDLTRIFTKGGTVAFSVICHDDTGLPLDLSGKTVKLVFARSLDEGQPLYTFTSDGAEITIPDAQAGLVAVSIAGSALDKLKEGWLYYYTIWVDDFPSVGGKFKLGWAVQVA